MQLVQAQFGLFETAILALYFLPAIVASTRKHHNSMAIGMLNLFLGWTVLGWIGALVWACTATHKTL